MIKPQAMAGENQTITSAKSKHLLSAILCLLLFLAIGSGVEGVLFEYRQQQSVEIRDKNVKQAEAVVARLQAELNAVIYLSNGIAENREIRQELSNLPEMGKLFTETLRISRHVQGFAVAKAYRIAFVYPSNDKGQTVDYDYGSHPTLWPIIQHSVDTRTPVLVPPNQTARGLTYFVPMFEEGQFWGILSTLVNDASLFSKAGITQTTGDFTYALRAQGHDGANMGTILGPNLLFDDPNAIVMDVAIPGGSWSVAVKSVTEPRSSIGPLLFRSVGWIFAALLASLTMAVLTIKRKLYDLALYDPLTELPSRHLFLDRLKQVIRRTKRNQGKFSILFINLNDFKSVNESHGEKVGDMMLAGIGKRMIGLVRHCDTVTRWVGDEFLILLDECPNDQANLIAENLRHQIELPVYCGEHKLRVGAAIGLATFPDDGQSLSALLKVADANMAKDKALHKI